MKILVLNAGSSSQKSALYDLKGAVPQNPPQRAVVLTNSLYLLQSVFPSCRMKCQLASVVFREPVSLGCIQDYVRLR